MSNTPALSPQTAKVGDGATVSFYSDAQANTITKVSPSGKTIEIQRDKATRSNQEDDVFSPGGFAGHTHSPNGQQWTYEADPQGTVRTARWSEKSQSFKAKGQVVFGGRKERYDYNF